MPKARHSSSPDHVRTTGSQSPTGKPIDDAPKAHHSTPQRMPLEGSENAYTALQELLRRDDGWLRIAPDSDGKVVWWKWKITKGKWAGHYAMVRGFVEQHEEALTVLNRKLANIDLGYDRPSRDTYYDQS